MATKGQEVPRKKVNKPDPILGLPPNPAGPPTTVHTILIPGRLRHAPAHLGFNVATVEVADTKETLAAIRDSYRAARERPTAASTREQRKLFRKLRAFVAAQCSPERHIVNTRIGVAYRLKQCPYIDVQCHDNGAAPLTVLQFSESMTDLYVGLRLGQASAGTNQIANLYRPETDVLLDRGFEHIFRITLRSSQNSEAVAEEPGWITARRYPLESLEGIQEMAADLRHAVNAMDRCSSAFRSGR